MTQTEREYAVALFTLAVEEGAVEEYNSALGLIGSVIGENPEYIEFLASPAIALEERIQAIDEAFSAHIPENVASFMKILCEHSQVRLFAECTEEYRKLAMAFSKTAVAEITSAVALSDEQKAGICKKLEKITGKSIEANYTIDESLIGGVKIEVEGKTFDGTVKHRLSQVKDVIIG